jgi:hypothetical protein
MCSTSLRLYREAKRVERSKLRIWIQIFFPMPQIREAWEGKSHIHILYTLCIFSAE